MHDHHTTLFGASVHLEPVLTPAGLEKWLDSFDWTGGADGSWTGTPWVAQAAPSQASGANPAAPISALLAMLSP